LSHTLFISDEFVLRACVSVSLDYVSVATLLSESVGIHKSLMGTCGIATGRPVAPLIALSDETEKKWQKTLQKISAARFRRLRW
jgi:hypothetical protein